MPIANRKDECALFERLLSNELGSRILLVEGTGERGKSTLLAEFVRKAQLQWGQNACAALELKQGLPLRQVFHAISQGLGGPACSSYLAAREAAVEVVVNANLAGAKFGNANEVRVGSDLNVNEAERGTRVGEALLEDLLRHKGPVLLILDTYDQATPECTKWLLEALLPVVARNARLSCVVGGRSIPNRTEYLLTWGELAYVQTLMTDITVDDWHEYACSRFPNFPRQNLENLYLGLKDRPGSIRTYIDKFGPTLPLGPAQDNPV